MLQGTASAESEDGVLVVLERRGLMPFEVGLAGEGGGSRGAGVPAGLLPLLTRQLATVLSSGTQLSLSLEMLAGQPFAPSVKAVLRALMQDVRGGVPFSEALLRFPRVFSPFYVQMVRVGEATGSLDASLERVADHLDKAAATRSKVVGALTYPVAVLVVGLLLTFGLLRFVVPQFAGILQSLGGELPAATLLLMSVSDFVSEQTLLLLAPGALLVLAVLLLRRSEAGRLWLGRSVLRLPVFGPLFVKGEASLLSSTLSTAVTSGLTLVDAIDLGLGASGNAFVQQRLRQARSEVEQGRSLREAFSIDEEVFPPLFVSMVSIGEESGDLTRMLEKITLFYDREVDAASARMVSLLQPLMVVFLGFVVGGLAYALFSPVFSLVASV